MTWFTLRQAAAYTQVSDSTIRREARASRLRGYKVGGRRLWRFRKEDVDDWLVNASAERKEHEP